MLLAFGKRQENVEHRRRERQQVFDVADGTGGTRAERHGRETIALHDTVSSAPIQLPTEC
jgi:hypothetical protein